MIEFKNVTKVYKQKNKEINALKPTNLQINKGEIFGVIGYSGAGKSTLLRCINLLERQSSGTIIVDGQDVAKLNRTDLRIFRQKVGMIFQHFNLINSKTIYDNIAFNLKASGTAKENIAGRVDELLELVGLSDKKHSYPGELSGGQKQRVGIAKALANNPKILLCDEATSALDPVTTKQILSLLQEINRKLNVTIVLITHEMEVIKEICHRVAVMEDGNIIELNSVYNLFANPQQSLTKEFLHNFYHDNSLENISSSADEKIVTITFKESSAEEALIINLAQRFDVKINIIAGRIEYIQNRQLGSLTISITGNDSNVAHLVSYLQNDIKEVEVKIYD